MGAELSVFASFAAGLFSFFSPCVLPLFPSFLSVLGSPALRASSGQALGGGGYSDAPAARGRHVLAGAALSFIMGFSCVFTLLGIVVSGAGILPGGVSRILNTTAGIIVIVFGLNIIFGFLSFLNYEKRFRFRQRPRGLVGAFLTGAAFGAGWSPCVGPILGSILLLAGTSGRPSQAALYLVAYSAGLGLPFFLAALFFEGFQRRLAGLKAWIPFLRVMCGVFLVGIGLCILLGRLTLLNAFFLKSGYLLASWAESGGLAARMIPSGLFLLAAFAPFAYRAVRSGKDRGRAALSAKTLALCGLFLLLGAAQAAGLIDCVGLAARWFLYQGL
jgi:cytochrome c-type biogenesis protein